MTTSEHSSDRVTRRGFLGVAGSTGAGLIVAGCGVKSSSSGSGGATGRTVKLGYVTPQTGPLAPFGEADNFVIDALRPQLRSGVRLGAKRFPLEVVVKDSQSDPKRAADVASELILKDKVDLMLVASTPDTVNPVADQCEANGVPCLSSVAPWDAFVFGRKGTPDKPFKWTYHFFWGLDTIVDVYTDMWEQLGITNADVGALAPNDSDGKAWADPSTGAFPLVEKKGYTIVDGGRYQDLTNDYSAQISRFKNAKVPAMLGVPLPPDFTTFWKQAAQQGFKPRIATIAKALLFPSSVEALGDIGNNLGTEVWWSPSHPYTSSLTKQTAAQLAAEFTKSTKKQWTQPIGLVHALFEVGIKVLTDSGDIDNKQKIVDSIAALKLDTVAGEVDFTSGPVKNVATTVLVGGQWRQQSPGKFDLVIVSNNGHPEIPAGGKVQEL